MSLVKIPLDKSPNQSFIINLPINNKNVKLFLEINYREVCNYWTMTIKDGSTKEVMLTNIPLLYGGKDIRTSNALQQYQYLEIGSAFVMKTAEVEKDSPDVDSLGTEFVLVWGDNYDLLVKPSNF